MNWLDIVIIALMGISALMGYKTGVIKGFLSIIGIIVGVTVGGGEGSDELAGSGDTELQTQDVAFIETEETEEPVTEDEATEEVIRLLTDQPLLSLVPESEFSSRRAGGR